MIVLYNQKLAIFRFENKFTYMYYESVETLFLFIFRARKK